MANNPESIEAQLAAFIDGELDAAGQAELEKHLAANPQHRALLDELTIQKGYVQALPREAAPPEMAETLQGHLERSVLLDGVGTADVSKSLHVNRWPQVFGIAAVLLLAAGLAVLVYEVLPSRGNLEPTYAVAKESKDKKDLSRSDGDRMADLATTVPTIAAGGSGGGGAIEPTIPAASTPALSLARDVAPTQMSQQVVNADAQLNNHSAAGDFGNAANFANNAAANVTHKRTVADDEIEQPRQVEVTLTSADPTATRRLITHFCGERLYAIAPVLKDQLELQAVNGVGLGVQSKAIATLPSVARAVADRLQYAASQPATRMYNDSPATQPGFDSTASASTDMVKQTQENTANGPATPSSGNSAAPEAVLIRGVSGSDAAELLSSLAAGGAKVALKTPLESGASTMLGAAGGRQPSPTTTMPFSLAYPATEPTASVLDKAAEPTTQATAHVDLLFTFLSEPTTLPAESTTMPTTMPMAAEAATRPVSLVTQPVPTTMPTTLPTTLPDVAPDPSVMP